MQRFLTSTKKVKVAFLKALRLVAEMEHTACNLCGSDDVLPVFSASDRLFSNEEVFQVVRCRTCGLEYVNPRPSMSNMSAYYPADYLSFCRSRGIFRFLNTIVLASQARFIAKAVGKPQATVLEVGCATGRLLKQIQDRSDYKVIGVDTDKDSVDVATRLLGVQCIHGTLDDAGFPDNIFDAVIIKHTLEHTHNPTEVLQEANRVLRSGGKLFLWVPNKDGWAARLFGRYWSGYDLPRHLYTFGVDTLSRMVERAGFEINNLNCYSVTNIWIHSVLFFAKEKKIPHFIRALISVRNPLLIGCFLLPSIFASLLQRGSRLRLVCHAVKKEERSQ